MTKYEQAKFMGPLPSDAYRDNYDRIFRGGEEQTPSTSDEPAGDSSPLTFDDLTRMNEAFYRAREGWEEVQWHMGASPEDVANGVTHVESDCSVCQVLLRDEEDRLDALEAYLTEKIAAQEDADPREIRRIMGWAT